MHVVRQERERWMPPSIKNRASISPFFFFFFFLGNIMSTCSFQRRSRSCLSLCPKKQQKGSRGMLLIDLMEMSMSRAHIGAPVGAQLTMTSCLFFFLLSLLCCVS